MSCIKYSIEMVNECNHSRIEAQIVHVNANCQYALTIRPRGCKLLASQTKKQMRAEQGMVLVAANC